MDVGCNWSRLLVDESWPRSIRTPMHQHDVDANSIHPSREPRGPAKLGQTLEDLQEDLLHDVVELHCAPEHPRNQPHHTFVVPMKQLGESLWLATVESRDEVHVVLSRAAGIIRGSGHALKQPQLRSNSGTSTGVFHEHDSRRRHGKLGAEHRNIVQSLGTVREGPRAAGWQRLRTVREW
jgi:hypothetical protein